MRTNRHWFAVVLAGAIAALTAGPFLAQQPNSSAKDEVALRAAIEKETVQGDLPGAIEAYKKLSVSKDRNIAARALLGMAESYQKLGDTESRRIYERIVREYSDQESAFATARERLSTTGVIGARPANDRVVLAGNNVFGDEGSVSRDGRYMTDIDYNFTGNLMLHDLVTGKDRALTGNKDWSVGNASTSAFSPDGKRIAYGWRTYGTPDSTNDLRIISLEGAGVPQPKRLVTSSEVSYYDPTDWSRDGRWLAVTIERKDLTKQIALIGVTDAAVRVLKTIGWRGPGKILFSPDGKYIAYSLPVHENEAQRDVFVMSVDGANEMAVVQSPANDVLMGWSPNGAHLIFTSDRTGMGLWAVAVKDGRAQASPYLLKPNIGLISSVGITASGALVVVRDASTLGLYSAPFDLKTGKLTGPEVLQSFWSEYPTWSPDGQYLSYAFTGSGNGRTLAIRSTASGEVRELRPALQYFRYAAWAPDSKWLITNGRDFKGRSGIFRIDAQTGATSVILDRQGNGADVSPDGRKIYYGVEGWLVEQDIASGQTRRIVRGGGQSRELSPDGRLFAMIRSDEGTKTSTLLVVSVDNGESREVHQVRAPAAFRPFTNISWTPDGRTLLAVKSGERDEGKELWLVPVYGGAPRKLDIDISGWEMGLGIRLHPNGRQIAFFSGKSSREAWVYENVTAGIKP